MTTVCCYRIRPITSLSLMYITSWLADYYTLLFPHTLTAAVAVTTRYCVSCVLKHVSRRRKKRVDLWFSDNAR